MSGDRNRVAGLIKVNLNGEKLRIAAAVTFNVGAPKRDDQVGQDEPHGYSETPQMAFIEGEGRTEKDFSIVDFVKLANATVTMVLATGQEYLLNDAWQANEGDVKTENGTIAFKFCSVDQMVETVGG